MLASTWSHGFKMVFFFSKDVRPNYWLAVQLKRIVQATSSRGHAQKGCLIIHFIFISLFIMFTYSPFEVVILWNRLRQWCGMVGNRCLVLRSYISSVLGFPVSLLEWRIDYRPLLVGSVISSHTGAERVCWLLAVGCSLCVVFEYNLLAKTQTTRGNVMYHPD